MPEDLETVLIAETAGLVPQPPPPGVELREVTERADLERIDELQAAVWGAGAGRYAGALAQERAADPDALAVVVAEAAGTIVSAGWVRFPARTGFGTL